MEIWVYSYQTDAYGGGDLFVSSEGKVLGEIYEDDGNWRHEYFNPIFANAKVHIVNGGCFTEDNTKLYSKLKDYLG